MAVWDSRRRALRDLVEFFDVRLILDGTLHNTLIEGLKEVGFLALTILAY